MPIIRYVCLVGSLLIGMLFLLDDQDKPANVPAPDRWTAVDSLRAMAHLGEPVQGFAGNARFARREQAVSESSAQRAEPEAKLSVMNAQANMDTAATIPQRANKPSMAVKPRKSKIANRQIRLRTAIADNTQQSSAEVFRPPSW